MGPINGEVLVEKERLTICPACLRQNSPALCVAFGFSIFWCAQVRGSFEHRETGITTSFEHRKQLLLRETSRREHYIVNSLVVTAAKQSQRQGGEQLSPRPYLILTEVILFSTVGIVVLVALALAIFGPGPTCEDNAARREQNWYR
jgi:hypothetical protein